MAAGALGGILDGDHGGLLHAFGVDGDFGFAFLLYILGDHIPEVSFSRFFTLNMVNGFAILPGPGGDFDERGGSGPQSTPSGDGQSGQAKGKDDVFDAEFEVKN